jgi:hypothetical protein
MKALPSNVTGILLVIADAKCHLLEQLVSLLTISLIVSQVPAAHQERRIISSVC